MVSLRYKAVQLVCVFFVLTKYLFFYSLLILDYAGLTRSIWGEVLGNKNLFGPMVVNSAQRLSSSGYGSLLKIKSIEYLLRGLVGDHVINQYSLFYSSIFWIFSLSSLWSIKQQCGSCIYEIIFCMNTSPGLLQPFYERCSGVVNRALSTGRDNNSSKLRSSDQTVHWSCLELAGLEYWSRQLFHYRIVWINDLLKLVCDS